MKKNSPLLGYNTNVRHDGTLFHIQTEDSGVERPHIITHLFVEGTILASKKSSYDGLLEKDEWESDVRQQMKDQHRAMFVELRDGVHDKAVVRLAGHPSSDDDTAEEARPVSEPPARQSQAPTIEIDEKGVRVIPPAQMGNPKKVDTIESTEAADTVRGRSIFDMPDNDGEFGDTLITDKSLDEVILSYLTDELDE